MLRAFHGVPEDGVPESRPKHGLENEISYTILGPGTKNSRESCLGKLFRMRT